ncbi:MAG: alpha/beta hydrolase [Deltaproteobacteria bacterium]|nr:alpha/beta hydrolase [Deltaproteobacteria bacterium]
MKTVRIIYSVIIICFILPGHSLCAGQISNGECVVLLHGLARTKHSMNTMEKQLKTEGFEVVNWGYPSRHHTIEKLAEDAIPAAVEACRNKGATTIHFVTHSMGSILVRYYLKHHEIKGLGRVIMLSPPNGGSEVVDTFKDTFPFRFIHGPAGKELGTDAFSLPRRLGKVEFDSGVITGDRSINLINSLLIPGTDDGKVSVTNAQVEGMSDFLVVHVSHPFIMKNREVITQTIYFLKNGKFNRNEGHRKE